MKLSKFAFLLAAALLAPLSNAQTIFDKIELGNTVSGSISLGTFATPYPLPPGQWKVLKIKTDRIPLSNGQSTARWYFFMLETSKQSAIHSLLITITPDSSSIDWGNVPCKAKSAKNTFFVETLDTTTSTIEYFCGMATRQIPLKAMVDSSARSTKKWLGLFEQLSPNDKWSTGGSQRCRVVHGGGRRLRRTGRRGGQLGAHQQISFYATFTGFGRLAQ
jgi:hypothetical protein